MRKQRWDILEKSAQWKGEEAGYTSKHDVARKYWSKSSCEECGKTTTLHMANISGHYIREASDWRTLCAKCHFLFDNMAARIRKHYPLGASGHRGVKRHAQADFWVARITIEYKEIHLGIFKDKEDAIMIRLAAEAQLL